VSVLENSLARLLATLARDVKPFLRARGFAGTGTIYRLDRDGNRVVVQLQSSNSSTRRAALITVNLGVWSRRVATFDDSEAAERRVHIYDCHWRSRLGEFDSPASDRWWTVEGTAQDAAVRQDIERLLAERALPVVEGLSADEALRDLWLSGRSPGRTNFQRLYDLSVLLVQIGPSERLPTVLRELAALPTGGSMKAHIRRLEALEPPQ
jgi:hypothetical protein